MRSSAKKNKKLKLAFLGRGKLGMIVLKNLLNDSNVLVKVIISCASSPEVGFSEEDFKKIAEKHQIDFYKTNNLNNEKYRILLKGYDLDLGIALLWLNTISKNIINTCKLGIVNCHSGLLPKYRGNACNNWAILNDEKEIGITIHFMEGERLDNGPIILQQKINVGNNTYVDELTNAFVDHGAILTLKVVKMIYSNKKIKLITQQNDKASYCYPRLPSDGEIDWKQPSQKVFALIRATSRPYPGAYSYFSDIKDNQKIKKMIIWKAHIENHPLKQFFTVPGHVIKLNNDKRGIGCADNKLIILDQIEIDGKPVKPHLFFESARQRMGLDMSGLLAKIDK